MTLLKCATHVVGNLPVAIERYVKWLDYSVVEQGKVSVDLAASWLSPACAERTYAILRPAYGSEIFIRLVQGDIIPGFREQPMHTYGWSATEICVQDVDIVHERMLQKDSPFEAIGHPHVLDGFSHVKPMQVLGRDDGELLYLTSFISRDPNDGLPKAQSLIDRPFIMVLACEDLRRCMAWVTEILGLQMKGPIAIRNTMIQRAWGLGLECAHELTVVEGEGEAFLEVDELPKDAVVRPHHPGALPPGVAITTMVLPDFDRLDAHWTASPVRRKGNIYEGRRVGMLRTPDGALLEVIEQ